MAMTNAERQRRYRERRRAERQKQAPVTPVVTDDEPRNAVTGTPDLGTRGRRLWQQVTEGGEELRPAERVLLEEACRAADRLDVLDRILRGDEDAWMRLHAANDDGSIVKVVLNGALAEARQQQVTLKQLLAELRQGRAAGVGAGGKPAGPAKPKSGAGGGGVAGVTNLAARIAAKRGGQAAG